MLNFEAIQWIRLFLMHILAKNDGLSGAFAAEKIFFPKMPFAIQLKLP